MDNVAYIQEITARMADRDLADDSVHHANGVTADDPRRQVAALREVDAAVSDPTDL